MRHLDQPQVFITYVWLVWVASWWIAALWADKATKRPNVGAGLLYRAAVMIGAVLLFGFGIGGTQAGQPLWTTGPKLAWLCVATAIAGLAFCWWARLHIGPLWSTQVDRKAGHRVIDTGPYAIVRHPIYAGIMVAAFATAALVGRSTAIAGAGVMSFGFWIRARLEERFLRDELGAGLYDAYRRRVPMLVPFWTKN